MDTLPQWSYFAKKWKALPSRAYELKETFGGRAVKGDFRQRTWTDLYIKRLVEAIREYNWDGIYYDCFGVDVFNEGGESFLPVFDVRDFQEHVYVAQRLHRADSLTVSHKGFFATVLNSSDKPQEFSLNSTAPFSNAEYFDPVTGKALRIKNGDKLQLEPYMAAFVTIARP
jgi:hypothetical protein